jgi:Flp pilus assembly protein TadD
LALTSFVDAFDGLTEQGVADGQRAILLNPNYAGVLGSRRRPAPRRQTKEAISSIQKAIRLDSQSESVVCAGVLGMANLFVERYQEAIELLEQHVTAMPNDTFARMMLAVAYREAGREQDARSQASETMRLNPQYKFPAPTGFFPKTSVLARRYLADLLQAGLK